MNSTDILDDGHILAIDQIRGHVLDPRVRKLPTTDLRSICLTTTEDVKVDDSRVTPEDDRQNHPRGKLSMRHFFELGAMKEDWAQMMLHVQVVSFSRTPATSLKSFAVCPVDAGHNQVAAVFKFM